MGHFVTFFRITIVCRSVTVFLLSVSELITLNCNKSFCKPLISYLAVWEKREEELHLSLPIVSHWSSVFIYLQGRLESIVFIHGSPVPAENYLEREEENG